MSNLWLFQFSADVYAHGDYRQEIWEGQVSPIWNQNRVTGDGWPEAGDRLVCWYARTVSEEPGIWGWGVVISVDDKNETLRWRPTPPSDFLKMTPIFDAELDERIKEIRRFPQGTMWLVQKADAAYLTQRIASSIGLGV